MDGATEKDVGLWCIMGPAHLLCEELQKKQTPSWAASAAALGQGWERLAALCSALVGPHPEPSVQSWLQGASGMWRSVLASGQETRLLHSSVGE